MKTEDKNTLHSVAGLVALVEDYCKFPSPETGAYVLTQARPQDMICAMASLCGEAGHRLIGLWDGKPHNYSPRIVFGGEVLTARLCGGKARLMDLVGDTSLMGLWATQLYDLHYPLHAAPNLLRKSAVYEKERLTRHGYVRMNLPAEHLPLVVPPKVNCDLRDSIDFVAGKYPEESPNVRRFLALCTTLTSVITKNASKVPPKIALEIACSAMIGMTKNVALMPEHFRLEAVPVARPPTLSLN